MSTILITGGLGFLGSNLVRYLLGKGNELIILDKAPTSKLGFLERHEQNRVRFIHHDLCTFEGLPALVSHGQVVIHLAATSDTRESQRNFRIDLDNSISATWNLLEALRLNVSCRHFVFTSSQHVYGSSVAAQVSSLKESSELQPISPYAAAKISAESIIEVYSKLHNIPTSILRLSNMVGPGANFGVLVDLLKKVRSNSRQLPLWGNGQQARNFLHVSDFCSAIDILVHSETAHSFRCYNLANRDSVTVRRIAELILDELGIKGCSIVTSSSSQFGWKGDPGTIIPNIERIMQLGWAPKLDCEAAIRKAIHEL